MKYFIRIIAISVIFLWSTKESMAQVQPDSCINEFTIIRNTALPANQAVIDQACYEIILDEGFESEDYIGEINSGNNILLGLDRYGNPLAKQFTNSPLEDISVIATVRSGKVYLRWIPKKAEDWEKTAKNKYVLSRAQKVNGVWQSEVTLATLNGITLADSTFWYNKTDSTYGDIYETTTEVIDPTGLSAEDISLEHFFKFYNATSIYNTRFDIAKSASHGHVDSTVVAGNEYRYKVTGYLNTTSTINSGTGLEVTATSGGTLPTMQVIATISENRNNPTVNISWRAKELRKYYSTYNLFRINQAGVSLKLNETPIVYNGSVVNSLDSTLSEEERISEINNIVFTDSLPNTSGQYSYLVKGYSYFGDSTSFDLTYISVKRVYLEYVIVDSIFTPNPTQYGLAWKYMIDSTQANESFLSTNAWQIYVANNESNVQFKKVGNPIAKHIRSSTFSKMSLVSLVDTTKTLYFKLAAITADNDTIWSQTQMFVPEDHTPPAKPTGFSYTEIKDGNNRAVLKFNWNPNTETDLLGYIIKRQIGENDSLLVLASPQFVRPANVEITDTFSREPLLNISLLDVRDTLALNLSYPVIYYSIIAVDFNNNESDSMVIQYIVPDTIRPLPPLIKSMTSDTLGNVSIDLVYSPELGTTHKIIRLDAIYDDWSMADTIRLTASQRDVPFTNLVPDPGHTYYYIINAYDAAGNESCFGEYAAGFSGQYTVSECYQIRQIQTSSNGNKPIAISDFSADYDNLSNNIKLTWETNTVVGFEVKEIEIYKAVKIDSGDTTKLSLYKIARNFQTEFIDNSPVKSRINEYMIRAVMQDSNGNIRYSSSINAAVTL